MAASVHFQLPHMADASEAITAIKIARAPSARPIMPSIALMRMDAWRTFWNINPPPNQF